MIIDYIGHSCFLVETEHQLLLFDYFRGNLLPLLESKPSEKPLSVFVSHAHPDHFNPEIFSLRNQGRDVRYFLSFDLRGNSSVNPGADILYLDADNLYDIPGFGTVQTLLSTDEGVAYWVQTDGTSVFHAGDLNWWNWDGEDPEWLAGQERVFKQEMSKLAGMHLDAAFVVLDDRLGAHFSDGMNWFLSVSSPTSLFPMHFWNDRTVIDRFIELPERSGSVTRILDTVNETHWNI